MTRTGPIDIAHLVPMGILPTDHWHRGKNDDTCSRCRREIGEDEVPLLLWANDGHDMLIFCEACLGIEQGEPDCDQPV